MPERHLVVRQVYVVGAVIAFVGTFMPLFATSGSGNGQAAQDIYATMNLWTAIAEDGGGAAAVGVVIVLAMVAAALLATRPERASGPPSAVLLLALVAVLMLVLKPGTGSPAPSLGPGAGLLLGTALVLAATALYDVLGTSRADAPPVVLR